MLDNAKKLSSQESVKDCYKAKKLKKICQPDKITLGEMYARVYAKPLIKLKGQYIEGPRYQDLKPISYKRMLKTGLQASTVARAAKVYYQAIKTGSHISLGFTSNAGTSGLRQLIASLIAAGYVHSITCSAGALEQDFMKSFSRFRLGVYRPDDGLLHNNGINRTGNIYLSNSCYIGFESKMKKFLDTYKKRPVIMSELFNKLGLNMSDKNSIIRQAAIMGVPIFCPCPLDSALGDLWYFHMKDVAVDSVSDHVNAINNLLYHDRRCIISLGGGTQKHAICNAHLIAGPADYAVYLNNSVEYQGSNAGATVSEAVSWGKVKNRAKKIKIHGDFILNFPLVVAVLKSLLQGEDV